jgi:ADP-heptose:LPS heptosyltransferase
MLLAHQRRRFPNKGRYLFHNRALRALLGAVDFVLKLLPAPSQQAISATPRRILVCNQAHIGDAIWASSVLPVLQAAFPSARIGFLAHPASVGVLSGNPGLAWVHRFEHWRLNRSPLPLWRKLLLDLKSRRTALREIRAIGYEMAIDLYPHFPNSVTLLCASGIPTRLGWTSAGCGGLLTHALDWQYQTQHVVDWHKTLLAQIAACRPHLALAQPGLHGSAQLRSEWLAIAAQHSVPSEYLAFHVGTGGVHRRWPELHWQMLARMCTEVGHRLVLLGHGSDEEGLCRRIAALSESIIDLSGRLSWPQMSEAVAHARLLVGLESASAHVAAARDVPAVCIYSGISHASLFRPYHPRARVLVHPMPCSPCNMSAGCMQMECVRLTSAQTVFDAVCETLQSCRRGSGAPSQEARAVP